MNPDLKPTKKEIVTAFRTREILAAARRLMQSRGVEAVTMEEIAAAAGVAKGTVYLYFQGKEDLIQDPHVPGGGESDSGPGDPAGEARPTGEKLTILVTGLLKFIVEERFLFPFYVRDVIRGGVSERQVIGTRPREMEAGFMALLERFFAAGIQAREFIPADPRLLSYLLRGLVRAVGYYQMSQKDGVGDALPVVKARFHQGCWPDPGARWIMPSKFSRLISGGALGLGSGRHARGRGNVAQPGPEGGPAPGLEGQPRHAGQPSPGAYCRRGSDPGPVRLPAHGEIRSEPEHLRQRSSSQNSIRVHSRL